MSKNTSDKSIDIVLSLIPNPLKRKVEEFLSDNNSSDNNKNSSSNIQRIPTASKRIRYRDKNRLKRTNSITTTTSTESKLQYLSQPTKVIQDIYSYSVNKLSYFASKYIYQSSNTTNNINKKSEVIRSKIEQKLSKPNLNLKYLRIESLDSPSKRLPKQRMDKNNIIDTTTNNITIPYIKKEKIEKEIEVIEVSDSDDEKESTVTTGGIEENASISNDYISSPLTKLSHIDSIRLLNNKQKNQYSIENLVQRYQKSFSISSDVKKNNDDDSIYQEKEQEVQQYERTPSIFSRSLNSYSTSRGFNNDDSSSYNKSIFSTPQTKKPIFRSTSSSISTSPSVSPIKLKGNDSFLDNSGSKKNELRISDLDSSNLFSTPTSTSTNSTSISTPGKVSIIRNLRPKLEELNLGDPDIGKINDKFDSERQKDRDSETNSLLKKLDEIHKSNKYSILKQLNERIELERNAKPVARSVTLEEDKFIRATLIGHEEDILQKISTLAITKHDVRTLEPGKWLNDEVINFYVEMMKARQLENPGKFLKCHFFNSFFYLMLCNNNETYNYERVKKWTNTVDIFSLDKIIIPIHMGNHWCLAVVNMKEKKFEYFDSLKGENPTCIGKLKRYLGDEMNHRNKKGIIDLSEFKTFYPKDIPTQYNGYDCGVFLCKYADYQARGIPMNFSQKDITLYRRLMILEILNKKMH